MAMHRRRKSRNEGIEYWQSYSDMMAALLLMFVLIIAFTITQAKADYEKKQAELMESQAKAEEYQIQVKKQQEQLDQIIGVRADLISDLKSEFENSDLNVNVDPQTGAISFDSNILFDYNQYELKPSGKEFLNTFLPKYYQVIFQDEIKDYVSEVIIEGHTDNIGTYLYNLDLSQKRAFSVAEYCLDDNNNLFTPDQLNQLREVVTANGRSYNGLVQDESGNVDAQASRRVEIKFRLKEEEMVEQMNQLLEDTQ